MALSFLRGAIGALLVLAFAMPAAAQSAKVASEWGLNPGGAIVSTSGATVSGGDITFTANGQSVVIDAAGAGGFSLQAAGTWSGTIQLQASDKPTSGFAPVLALPTGSDGLSPNLTASGQFIGNTGGRYLRLTTTSWSSGSAVLTPMLHQARFPAGKTGLAAGEAFVGKVGSDTLEVSASPTVTASSAYASGNVVGGLLTFANAGRVAGGSGLLQGVTVLFKSAQSAPLDFVWCGSSQLPGTTLTNKAAVAVAASDFDRCRVVHVTDCTSLGTPTVCQAEALAMPFTLASGTSGYGFLVTRGTPTFSSTSDVTVTLRLLRN